MKKATLILLSVLFTSSIFGQTEKAETPKLKTYHLVILTKGANRTQPQEEAMKIQEGHLANITRLHKEGKIDLAGPFDNSKESDDNWRGVFVFNVQSKEEVEKLLQTDPAISSGRLSYIIKPWMSESNNCLR
ncbi:MAG: hypothetical protein IPJ79_15720 [Bacteroidetes bacterium]|nr:hypothetical protein [Bacteroidota bacterium]